MSRAPVKLKKADIKRALSSAIDAGLNVSRVEIEDGRIVVVTGPHETREPQSALDAYLARRDARKA